jgi:hypothetical protein
MHFAVAVVTQEKPTESMLADALAPFGPAGAAEAKWDWYALGGRFSGHLLRHGRHRYRWSGVSRRRAVHHSLSDP